MTELHIIKSFNKNDLILHKTWTQTDGHTLDAPPLCLAMTVTLGVLGRPSPSYTWNAVNLLIPTDFQESLPKCLEGKQSMEWDRRTGISRFDQYFPVVVLLLSCASYFVMGYEEAARGLVICITWKEKARHQEVKNKIQKKKNGSWKHNHSPLGVGRLPAAAVATTPG